MVHAVETNLQRLVEARSSTVCRAGVVVGAAKQAGHRWPHHRVVGWGGQERGAVEELGEARWWCGRAMATYPGGDMILVEDVLGLRQSSGTS
jgi:hypothetical protein